MLKVVGGANPSSSRNPNCNPSPAKAAEHMCASTRVLLSAGRARIAIGVSIQARVSAADYFQHQLFLSVDPVADTVNQG